MTAGKAAYIIVIFESIDADGASIARRSEALGRKGSVDVFIIIFVMRYLTEALVCCSGIGIAV
jgi:hypothetical protein